MKPAQEEIPLTKVENSSANLYGNRTCLHCGSTWKEPGDTEECHRKQFYEAYFCVYCRDVVKDVVDDIPQCFLYDDLICSWIFKIYLHYQDFLPRKNLIDSLSPHFSL